jgi:Ca2+-binding RTX toxin-like protein
MAADSLFGGSDTSTLSGGSLALLNQYLTDTVGGSTTTESIGGSTYVSGAGMHGETQGGILPGLGAISGTIDDGVLHLNLNLPGASGLVFEGLDGATPDATGSFLKSVVSSYHPSATQQASLDAAVDQLVNAMKAQGVTDVVFRMFDIMANSGNGALAAPGAALGAGAHDIVLDASQNPGVQAFAVNLFHATDAVVLKGVEYALVACAGTIKVEDSSPIRLVGDLAAQDVTGGGGNDTLVGGGGNDTLTGGLGNDVFGFSALGHVTLTDFDVAHDKMAFSFAGLTNIQQLAALVTSVDNAPTGVTVHFGHDDASITLVGVSADQITSDLIKFTF